MARENQLIKTFKFNFIQGRKSKLVTLSFLNLFISWHPKIKMLNLNINQSDSGMTETLVKLKEEESLLRRRLASSLK
jgi:hypothetical protein